MRHYIKKVVPAKEVEEHTKTTCDLCGKEAMRGDWESSSYEVNETEIEVTVRQKDGRCYPSGGGGTQYQVDMCPDCFKNKLIPWLESQGCKAEQKDWDY